MAYSIKKVAEMMGVAAYVALLWQDGAFARSAAGEWAARF